MKNLLFGRGLFFFFFFLCKRDDKVMEFLGFGASVRQLIDAKPHNDRQKWSLTMQWRWA